jgi:hypothetical protein
MTPSAAVSFSGWAEAVHEIACCRATPSIQSPALDDVPTADECGEWFDLRSGRQRPGSLQLIGRELQCIPCIDRAVY